MNTLRFASEEDVEFIIFDINSLNIVYINDGFIKYLGFKNDLEYKESTKENFANLICNNLNLSNKFNSKDDISNEVEIILKTKDCATKKTTFIFKVLKVNKSALFYGYIKQNDNVIYDFDYEEGLHDLKRFIKYVSRDNSINKIYEKNKYAILYLVINNLNAKEIENEKDFLFEKFVDEIKKLLSTKYLAQISDNEFVIYVKDELLESKILSFRKNIEQKVGLNFSDIKVGIYNMTLDIPVKEIIECSKAAAMSIINEDDSVYSIYNNKILKDRQIYDYVTNNLDYAIKNNEILVYYQPVVRAISNELTSVEALARWQTKDFGILSPYYFISTLEQTKQIAKLDTYIFETICKELRHRLDNNLDYVPVSFNLSRLDFVLMNPFDMVLKLTDKYDIPHRLIKIEITESVIMSNIEEIKNYITKFNNEGFEIWMDDFGSAYSSLNMLKEFELDEIKLDLAFLSNLNTKGKIIIKNVISMAKDLGIQTLCEGVETNEQYNFLRNIGCDKMQGYLFSKPLPFNDMLNVLKNKNINVEKPKYRNYFTKLSTINFQTDLPLCILNLENNDVKVLYMNEACKKSLSVTGLCYEFALENKINTWDLNLKQKICNFENNSSFIHSISGHLFKISGKRISKSFDNYLYMVKIININVNEIEKVSKYDSCLRELTKMYSSMYYLDFKNGTIDVVIDDAYSSNVKDSIGKTVSNIRKSIYQGDVLKFDQFFDVNSLIKSCEDSKNSYVTGLFRFYNENKEITPINVIMILISKKDQKFLLLTRNLTIVESLMFNESIKIERAKRDLINVENNILTNYDMFISIIKNSLSNYYFKDINHKYIGASDTFLKTVHINHISQIIDKTDEELGINISNNKLFELENKVLNLRTEVKNETIFYVVKGSFSEIKINIFPICESNIVKGIFTEIYDINRFNNKNIDFTGLSNYSGFIETYLKYYAQYKYYNEDFYTFKIELTRLDELKKSFCVNFVKCVEEKVANKLVSSFGAISTIYHINYGTFVILKNQMDEKEVEAFKDKISNIIYDIKLVENQDITIFNEVNVLSVADDILKILKNTN